MSRSEASRQGGSMPHAHSNIERSFYAALVLASIGLAAALLSGCGGGDSEEADQPGTYPAHVQPTQQNFFFCGAAGGATNNVMSLLNTFWQSQVRACSCEV